MGVLSVLATIGKILLGIVISIITITIIILIVYLIKHKKDEENERLVRESDEGDIISSKLLEHMLEDGKITKEKINSYRESIRHKKIRQYKSTVESADAGDKYAAKKLSECLKTNKLTPAFVKEIRNEIAKEKEEKRKMETEAKKRREEEIKRIEKNPPIHMLKNIVVSKINTTFTKVAFMNGRVYLAEHSTGILIGYYDNKTVWNESHEEIAKLKHSDCSVRVYPNLLGRINYIKSYYEKLIKETNDEYKKNHYLEKIRLNSSNLLRKNAASLESWFSHIDDDETGDTVAYLESSDSTLSEYEINVGMAAAFICMQAEIRNSENKFTKYYHNQMI